MVIIKVCNSEFIQYCLHPLNIPICVLNFQAQWLSTANPDSVNRESWEMMSLPQVVLVNFQYEYTTRDGSNVAIKPNERYILVAKTNDHWWHVRKNEAAKPFFIPAQYVTVLPPENETTQFSSEQDLQDTLKQYSNTVPPVSLDVSIKDQNFFKAPNEKDTNRISKLVIPSDQHKTEPDGVQMDISQECLTNTFSLVKGENTYAASQPHKPSNILQKATTEPSEIQSNKNPYNDLSDDIQMLIRAGWDPKIWDLKQECIHESVDSVKDSVVQDTKSNEGKVEEELALISQVSPSSPPYSPQQSPGSPTDIPCAFTEKVQSAFLYSFTAE